VRLDRKLLLIAPTIVLLFVVAGLFYAASQLHALTRVSDTFQDRNAFISGVERGEKKLEPRQATSLLRWSLDVEAQRTAAVSASRDLLIELSIIAAVACIVLAVGIRSVPREHWPRMGMSRSISE
jgi:hypothetical protein